jgi:hypothetical protein
MLDWLKDYINQIGKERTTLAVVGVILLFLVILLVSYIQEDTFKVNPPLYQVVDKEPGAGGTGTYLELVNVFPESGEVITLNTYHPISFEFSQPIDVETARVSLNPSVLLYSLTVQGDDENILTITPRPKTPWQEGVTYSIVINGLESVVGSSLKEKVTHIFQLTEPEGFDPSIVY